DYLKTDVDSEVSLLILWGIPVFMVTREYLRMSKEDRQSAKSDFKTPNFIFTIEFLIAGAFLISMGHTLTIQIIKIVGIVLLFIGGIVKSASIWRKKNKLKSIIILALILLSIYL